MPPARAEPSDGPSESLIDGSFPSLAWRTTRLRSHRCRQRSAERSVTTTRLTRCGPASASNLGSPFPSVLREGLVAGEVEAPALERAFHGGRDVDRSMGELEELSEEGRVRRGATELGWRKQPGRGLPGREANERNAWTYDRSRGSALPEGEQRGVDALLHGPCADGEPQQSRSIGGSHDHERHGRAGRRSRHGCGASWHPPLSASEK